MTTRGRRRAIAASIVATIAAALLLWGCSADDPSGAERAGELYLEGLSYLYAGLEGTDFDEAPWDWNADVEPAMADFDEALEHDPDHCGALLGSALTHVLSTITDPELAEILSRLFPVRAGVSHRDGTWPRALLWYAEPPDVRGAVRHVRERRDDFHFSELQEYVEETAIPNLAIADERLARFEELDCVVELVLVLPDSNGSGRAAADVGDKLVTLEIDVADAYFAHAALDALEAVAHALASYDVDVDDGQTSQELIETDEDFLTLRPGGHLPHAYDEIASLAQNLADGVDALEAETDAQADDLVTVTEGLLPLEDLLGPGALELVRELADAVADALANGISVNPVDLDPGAPNVDMLIDLDELMNDPLVDVRDYLPEHTWPTPDSMHITRPVTLPDPTLDGITPGMTNEDWDDIVEWLFEP